MASIFLEHVNITAKNPKELAGKFCELFGWKIRWEGAAMSNGYTVHVGNERSYLALWEPENILSAENRNMECDRSLNHIGVVVENLEKAEEKITEAGYRCYSHADYEPGKRFYFEIENDLEVEVVSYS